MEMSIRSVEEYFFVTNLSQGGFHRRQYSSGSRIAKEPLYEAGLQGLLHFSALMPLTGGLRGKRIDTILKRVR